MFGTFWALSRDQLLILFFLKRNCKFSNLFSIFLKEFFNITLPSLRSWNFSLIGEVLHWSWNKINFASPHPIPSLNLALRSAICTSLANDEYIENRVFSFHSFFSRLLRVSYYFHYRFFQLLFSAQENYIVILFDIFLPSIPWTKWSEDMTPSRELKTSSYLLLISMQCLW